MDREWSERLDKCFFVTTQRAGKSEWKCVNAFIISVLFSMMLFVGKETTIRTTTYNADDWIMCYEDEVDYRTVDPLTSLFSFNLSVRLINFRV